MESTQPARFKTPREFELYYNTIISLQKVLGDTPWPFTSEYTTQDLVRDYINARHQVGERLVNALLYSSRVEQKQKAPDQPKPPERSMNDKNVEGLIAIRDRLRQQKDFCWFRFHQKPVVGISCGADGCTRGHTV